MASMFTMFTANNHGLLPDVAVWGDARGLPIFGMPRVSTKKTRIVTVNVTTGLPGIQSPLDKKVSDDGKLAAWTSVRQERWEGELVVEGEIPKWLSASTSTTAISQWLIGKSNPTPIKQQKKSNKLCYREFSEVPKHDNFLAYIGDLANLFFGALLTDNANTGVAQLADGRVVCLTETIKGSIVVNPNTLDTVEKFEYTDSWAGLIHSAHPIVTDHSEFITLLPDLLNPGYMVARMDPGTNERKVIGRVDCRGGPSPGWVHSFPVTEHYVIVPQMPLRYCAQNLLKAEPTPLYKFRCMVSSIQNLKRLCMLCAKLAAKL
ncbi:hypothetical protein L1887_00802 [Cichorium endivia]|nr:hypothetical protein L1887_00802 [Cichorium endivia]